MAKTIFLNSEKIDYDHHLDFTMIEKQGALTLYPSTPPKEIMQRISGHEIIVSKEIPLGKELVTALPTSVKLICEAGTGYNNIDIVAARSREIAVCNIPEYSTTAVAQLVFTFILNLSSSLSRQQVMLKSGELTNFSTYLRLPHSEVFRKTLGIIGAGKIGRQVIHLAQAFGMNVLVFSRTPRTWADQSIRSVSLSELLAQSDFVSIHCPLTPETESLIDQKALEQMKPSAYIINTARGAIIDEPALIEALSQGKLAGAALDVQNPEPPAEGNPLYRMKNVILTPHIGWKCLETRQRLLNSIAETIEKFAKGQPINLVN